MTDRKQNSREDLVWEEVSTEHVITDEWIDFRRQAFRLPDGSVFEPYYTFSRRDYVVIVPFDLEGKLLCVRQFRQGIGRLTTEFPAGGLEDEESPLDAARRELAEETGYTCGEMKLLMSVPAAPTISSNTCHIVLAENCRPTGEQSPDPYEFIEICTVGSGEMETLIRSGEFPQPGHIMAWLLWKNL